MRYIAIDLEQSSCLNIGRILLRLKWRQGFVGRVMDCPLCGAVEETVAHFDTESVVLEGVRKQFGVTQEEALIFRERTEEKVERSIALLEEKKRNGPTSAKTCTSVVQAYRDANKKAGHQRTSLSSVATLNYLAGI